MAKVAFLAVVFLCASDLGFAQTPKTTPWYHQPDAFPVFNRYSPGRWGIVGVTIVNPSDQPVNVVSSHYFNSKPDLQFARQLWIPPRTRRSTWHPLMPPDEPRQPYLPVKALLIDRSGKQEVFLKDPHGALVYDGLLPSSRSEEPVSGWLVDKTLTRDDPAEMLVRVARTTCRLSPSLLHVHSDVMPPTPKSLQALDQLVVSGDCQSLDPAKFRAIRQWVYGGGKLWIMLDRVPLDVVSQLIGEDLDWTTIDRVGLTQWQFQQELGASGLDSRGAAAPRQIRPSRRAPAPGQDQNHGQIGLFDPPVEMVKVLAGDVQPMYTIDGWPAAFWRRVGHGLVLFTTVAPHGWFVPYNANRNAPQALGYEPPPFSGNEPLQRIAAYFLKTKEKPGLSPDAFEPYLKQKVGYHIVSRWTVFLVLGLFCLGFGAAGVWLARGGNLAHLAWIGPGAALAVAGVLVVEGNQRRSAIPPTVAEVQWVEVAPNAEDAHVTGLVGLYNQEESSVELGAQRDGVFFPNLDGQAGVMHRMLWTDLDHWHWENITLSSGLHLARFANDVHVDGPLLARATFGPNGLVGKLRLGSIRDVGDALVALPAHRNMAVHFVDEEGSFAATPADELAADQFLTSSVLSDEQRRRQAMYQRVFDRRAFPDYPEKPTFLTWAAPLDLGFTYAPGVQRTGSALLALPLVFDRPAVDTRVLVPAPFLPYQSVLTAGGNYAPLYDSKNNEWVKYRDTSGKTMLRFQVPRELLPLHVERIKVTVDLNAQARPFQIFAGNGSSAKVLANLLSPVGKKQLDIDEAELLQPDETGGIYLGVAIGDAQKLIGETRPSSEWKINDLQIELVGRILEP